MVKPADFRPRFERKIPNCVTVKSRPPVRNARCTLQRNKEDMMRGIRILTALAALSIMTVASAAAQAETNTAPGNPIPLLKILAKPDKARTKIHSKRVGRRMGKTHMAAKRALLHRSARARPTAPTPADDALPTKVAAAPSATPPAPPAAASPASAVASLAEPMPTRTEPGRQRLLDHADPGRARRRLRRRLGRLVSDRIGAATDIRVISANHPLVLSEPNSS
jgi:hypothetical protein